eukprot:scaffold813_cov148-Amphora_coffeaeformis.AAC.8
MATLKLELGEKELELQSEREAYRALQKNYQAVRNENKDLERRVEEYIQQEVSFQALQMKYDALQAEKMQINKTLSDGDKTRQENNDDDEILEVWSPTETEVKIANLQASLRKAKDEISTLRNLQKQVGGSSTKDTDANVERDELRKQVEEAQKKAADAHRECENLRTQVEAAQKQAADMMRDRASDQAALEDLKRLLSKEHDRKKMFESEIRQYRGLLVSSKCENDDLRKKIQQATGKRPPADIISSEGCKRVCTARNRGS